MPCFKNLFSHVFAHFLPKFWTTRFCSGPISLQVLIKPVLARFQLSDEKGNIDFSATGFTDLKIIDLGLNNLTHVPNMAFRNNNKISTLNISHNYIKILHANSFTNLQYLTELILRNNTISSIQKNAFVGLTRLPILNISGQGLGHIDDNGLNDLKALATLDLS